MITAAEFVKPLPEMPKLTIREAKDRLPIPVLWRHFGFPGEPRESCRCPFHEDRRNSFSVYDSGLRWKCFAGCGGGDSITFLERATGLSNREACLKLIEMAGGSCIPAVRPPKCKSERKRGFPPFDLGTPDELEALAELRLINREGLLIARNRGLLRFAELRGHRAWVVTDGARRNAQARRLDGGLWNHLPDDPKAYTLPGSTAAWPIGAREAQPFGSVALCEGGPDLLAAFGFLWAEEREEGCTAVTMLGSSLDIHGDALPLLARKRVRIFGHSDEKGRAAVERWAGQLRSVGADVDAFRFDGLRRVNGSAVGDLNDATNISPDDFEANRELWNMMP